MALLGQHQSKRSYSSRVTKEREQASGFQLYPCTPENDVVVERVIAKEKEIDELNKERNEIRKTLKTLDNRE